METIYIRELRGTSYVKHGSLKESSSLHKLNLQIAFLIKILFLILLIIILLMMFCQVPYC
jgi:hypothetical protein